MSSHDAHPKINYNNFIPDFEPSPPSDENIIIKDEIGYDFIHPLGHYNPYSLAEFSKDKRDHMRSRSVFILEQFLGVDVSTLAHGLSGEELPWVKIQTEYKKHFPLAIAIREYAKIAPRGRLGVEHTFKLLHKWGYLRTYDITCSWDTLPYQLTYSELEESLGKTHSKILGTTQYFEIHDNENTVLAYVDSLTPYAIQQKALVRISQEEIIGEIYLTRPSQEEQATDAFIIEVHIPQRINPCFIIKELKVKPQYFFAEVYTDNDILIGFIEDKLQGGKITLSSHLNVPISPLLQLGILSTTASLSRLRKEGWPDRPEDPEQEFFPDIEEELGKRS